ncbi:MAG: Lrp/AsnC family transcriptional regulator [Deltaproteobacteria bacterium]|nr:MAG: Lrp/AsnC family transcriptional regulator [Deltaproteobacteria bacterium]
MDSLDIKILKALQASGRKKNVELARDLGVAPSTMLERVRNLEERGLVQGYRAIINPEMLDLNVQAFISVIINRHEADYIRKFEEAVQQISYIRACYHLTGRFDYLLHVAARDLKHLGELIKSSITSLPVFGKLETFLVFSEVKPDKGWPIEEDLLLRTDSKGRKK